MPKKNANNLKVNKVHRASNASSIKKNSRSENGSKRNLRAPNLSHHERNPGGWILRDEIAISGHKKRNHPTLAQLDNDWSEN